MKEKPQASKFTYGIPVYADFCGAYFTLKALQLYHPEFFEQAEIVVVDNSPTHPEGEILRKYVLSLRPEDVKYIPLEHPVGTCPAKQKIFDVASGEWVVVTDSHVLLDPGVLKKLIQFCEGRDTDRNIYSGPMVYDDNKHISTHLEPKWRGEMFGILATHPQAQDPNAEPFEVSAFYMGAFVCRRDAWPGFHPLAKGFGGEEWYIHEKFRRRGGMAVCLPFFRWHHRFGRAVIPYKITYWDKVRNYVLEWKELGWDVEEIRSYFVGRGFFTQDLWEYLIQDPENRLEPPPEGHMAPEIVQPSKGCIQCKQSERIAKEARLQKLQERLEAGGIEAVAESQLNVLTPSEREFLRKYIQDAKQVVEVASDPLASTVNILTLGHPEVTLYSVILIIPLAFEFDAIARKVHHPKRLLFRPYHPQLLTPPAETYDVLIIDDVQATAERMQEHLKLYLPKCTKRCLIRRFKVYTDDPNNTVLVGVENYLREHFEWSVIDDTKEGAGWLVLSKVATEKPQLPGTVTLATNFLQAVAKHFMSGAEHVTKEHLEARLKICTLCKHRSANRCTVCGCYLVGGFGGVGKAEWKDQTCPLGFWRDVDAKYLIQGSDSQKMPNPF